MSDIVLRVTPEELRRKADDFSSLVTDIKNHFDAIITTASKTRGYWQGEAGDKDRVGYASYQEDMDFIIRRLKEHPADLLSMAGIYESAENSIRETNAELKTDLIV